MARKFPDNVEADKAARGLRCSTCDARPAVFPDPDDRYGRLVRCVEHPEDPLEERSQRKSLQDEEKRRTREVEAIQMADQAVQERQQQGNNVPALVRMMEGEKTQRALRQLLPRTVNPEHFTRVILRATQTTPQLLKCEPISVINAVLNAATLGLEPNTPQGFAYLIPYGDQCQLIIGYKGLEHLAYQSGLVNSIKTDVVRDGDLFEYEEGLEPILRHVKRVGPIQAQRYSRAAKKQVLVNTGENVTHAYAIVRLTNGGTVTKVLDRAEIEARRSRSQQTNGDAWGDNYEEMAKKTAFRAITNSIPQAPMLTQAATVDEGNARAWEDSVGAGMADAIDAEYRVIAEQQIEAEQPQEIAEDVELTADVCPTHNVPWEETQYGWQHRIDGERGFCKANQTLRPYFEAVMASKGYTTEAGALNEWLKGNPQMAPWGWNPDRKPWSGLKAPTQMVGAIEAARALPDAAEPAQDSAEPASEPASDAGAQPEPADAPAAQSSEATQARLSE